MRVGILFGVGIGGAGNANVAPSKDTTASGGYAVSNGVPPLNITHKDHGPMVASEWWANTNVVGGSTLTITELILRDWPVEDPAATQDVADLIADMSDQIKALTARYPDAQYQRGELPLKVSGGERSGQRSIVGASVSEPHWPDFLRIPRRIFRGKG